MASALSYQTDGLLDAVDVHGETIDEKKLASSRASVTDVSFVEGSEGVTHEELATLRHLPDSIPFAAFLVVVVEFAERWTYCGTNTVRGNYIRAGLPPGSTTGAVPADHRADGVAGALGRGVQPGFWDPANPAYHAGGQKPRNITWDDAFVGEVARTFRAAKVFLFFPFFWWTYMQVDGNMSTVSASLVLGGTPNDLIGNVNPIAIILMIPVFDHVIYPALRSIGINYTPIKCIYTGFLFCGLAMLYSAVLQKLIYAKSPCHDNHPSGCMNTNGFPDPAPINVWVINRPYILVGIAEIFTSITSLEYAFTKVPRQMKGLVTALSQFPIAIASALGFTLTPVSTEDRFIWIYGAFGIVSWVTGTLFLITLRKLDAQEA